MTEKFSMIKPPLILTLTIDEHHAAYFNRLRKEHFPVERNFIDAHLTLFHALPDEPVIVDGIKSICEAQLPISMLVTGPVSIGNGVAFKIESAELMQLHKRYQQEWSELLTLQDKHTIWPHITIQNKVAGSEAKLLSEALKKDFQPFQLTASGVQVWQYLNGPWRFKDAYKFRDNENG